MATPMSASFSASASFTPSPVIATTWPFDCNAATIARFCCGVTRPNTECCSSASAMLVDVLGELAGVVTLTVGVREADALPATAPTVRGLSPEITLSVTPCSSK